VASFIGAMNFFRNATKEADGRFRLGGLRLRVPDGAWIPNGGPAVLAIRPEDAQVRENGRPSSVPDDAGNALRGTVLRVEYRGAVYRLSLRLHELPEEQAPFELEAPASRVRRLELVEGASLIVELPAERIRVYAA
jgi:ABC-type Fe3+/spermidine/putrescine transport system ATPase subunit